MIKITIGKRSDGSIESVNGNGHAAESPCAVVTTLMNVANVLINGVSSEPLRGDMTIRVGEKRGWTNRTADTLDYLLLGLRYVAEQYPGEIEVS
jgi:uncharacterized protein YsxB (DUF464 family)